MPGGVCTMEELEAETGISSRTLRQWIRLRILPAPIGKGRGSRYDQRHLLRARAVRALRAQQVSLPEVRQRLASLSNEQLAALALPSGRTTDELGVPMPPAAPSYPSTTYEVVPLMEGLSLFVSTELGPLPRRIADEIYRHYAIPGTRRV
ncbi:MAG: HTH-type transcriptional regulator cueR [Myxococcaceae bacterium]|nr:HTH-type transcriptional regulator cueR [Myxococcaceae bacterium]